MAIACPDTFCSMLSHFDEMVNRDTRDPKSLDDTLAMGIALSMMLDMTDNAMRLAVLEQGSPYDSSGGAEIESLYRGWLAPAATLLARIDAAEARGCLLSRAESFRQCVSEAAAALGDDVTFFDNDESAAVRDDAIDAHRQGRTVEFHELGN